ncbi:3-hydroxyacyl-CoA dehydrogenase NAD-binding domain-containing protein [Natronorubrum tibetense]|uniref:3-hydroxyacyl-CoA dehydrogenase NAD binding domain-containing protein n=1 Tax=Natronorubrum tibetense GA33 TaxID=1114856 RepID=L9VPN3_9EURY|nr:3-hydroxyacyl-CoA dehydrogenase NAD-binding domain-containing protein [Natronorubrum tibetense]ELY38942.1 hypothetical protein C496_16162 [Natronorubrum tibetense GA33]
MVVNIDDIETVAVVGAGQIGRGIGAVAVLTGYGTTITSSISHSGDADFVTEAAVEQQAVKQYIFADLAKNRPEGSIGG